MFGLTELLKQLKGIPNSGGLRGLPSSRRPIQKNSLVAAEYYLPLLPATNGAQCFKKVKIQHLQDGYGPGCWSKITHGSEFIDWLEQPARTDCRLAERSMLKIWESLGDMQICRCKSDAILASYDYDYGLELPGFKYRQRIFLHCPKCGRDRVLHKIPGFNAPLEEAAAL